MKNFKAAIFDMDGLLLDSEPLAKKAFDTVCEQYGLGDMTDVFMQFVGTNTKKGNAVIKQAIDNKIDVDEFNTTWRGLYGSWVEHQAVPLKEGVKEVLEYFKSHNTPMAVATSSKTAIAEHKLKKSAILHYFITVIGGDQLTHSKPDPEIFLKAAEHLSCDPKSCIAFEDSPNGVMSAVAADMAVVQIPDLIKPDATLLELNHIVLDEISEAITFDFEKHLNPAI
jgi:HAD superfamily hydrolase (TIGR01509 family)